MRSAASPRFSSNIPGFISYVILFSQTLEFARSARKFRGLRKMAKVLEKTNYIFSEMLAPQAFH